MESLKFSMPKHSPKKQSKEKNTDESIAGEYHLITMKTVRTAINRHFRDISQRVDIVKDSDFKEANDMLDAKVQTNLMAGLNLPTKY